MSYGSTLEEAMSMAEDLIAGLVLDEMEDGKQIPQSSKIEDVSFEELEKSLDIEDWDYVSRFKTYIAVDINMYAEKWEKLTKLRKNLKNVDIFLKIVYNIV